MDLRQLYIAKCEELRVLLADAHEYNLLKTSAVVRHLIMDGGALTKQVARMSGQPTIFPVASGGMVENAKAIFGEYPAVFTVGDSVFPEDHKHARPWRDLKIDKFLKEPVLVLGRTPYTIQDVIDYTAHVAGGVHTNPINDRMRELQAKNGSVLIFGLPPTEALMRGIGRSVLHACSTNEIWCLHNLGHEALSAGHPEEAEPFFERVVAHATAKGYADAYPEHFEMFKADLQKAQHLAAFTKSAPS